MTKLSNALEFTLRVRDTSGIVELSPGNLTVQVYQSFFNSLWSMEGFRCYGVSQRATQFSSGVTILMPGREAYDKSRDLYILCRVCI